MEFHFDRALRILLKTYPFLLLRLTVYSLVLVGTVIWWVGALVLFANWPLPGPAWIAFPIAGILYASLARLVRNYVLYLLKAAHISVIARLVLEGDLPAGRSQILFGKDKVLDQFLQVTVFFAIDRLVSRVLRTFNRSVFAFLHFVPARGLIRDFGQKVLDYSAGYVDEAVLSYTMVNPQRNPWDAAREGLVLYVQNWKTILGSGAVLAVINYLLVAVVAAPGVLFSLGLPETARAGGIGISVGLGLLVKFAVMDPFALTSVVVNYHSAIAGQAPEAQWEKKLGDISAHFREIGERAAEWGGRAISPATPPPPPASGPVRIG